MRLIWYGLSTMPKNASPDMKWAPQMRKYSFGSQTSRLMAQLHSLFSIRAQGKRLSLTPFSLLCQFMQPIAQQLGGIDRPMFIATSWLFPYTEIIT